MIKKTDIAIYKVTYKQDNKMFSKEFKTFAAAAGMASALNGIRFINVEFKDIDGGFGLSGSLYVYNKNNERRACNNYLINQVLLRKGA